MTFKVGYTFLQDTLYIVSVLTKVIKLLRVITANTTLHYVLRKTIITCIIVLGYHQVGPTMLNNINTCGSNKFFHLYWYVTGIGPSFLALLYQKYMGWNLCPDYFAMLQKCSEEIFPYSKPCKLSKVELSAKIVNGF